MSSAYKWFWVAGAALLALASLGLAAWGLRADIAVLLAPPKVAAPVRSADAIEADKLFWETFHGGRYEDIQKALDLLTAAYLRSPNDAVTAAHIAWLHNWRVAESARLVSVPATITDDMTMARKYFQEAVALDPSDARYLGFLAGTTLGEASIDKDEKRTRAGYFMMMRAVDAWPEFNLFTAGYVFSRLDASDGKFRDGVEYQWRTLDLCIGGKIDRANPGYAQYMHLETRTGLKRVCWNSWIAPHNFEGFFLNMGDMLVKAGDWRMAQKIYANAKLSRQYAAWKYRGVLDDRIANAQANVAVFNAPSTPPEKGIMLRSRFSCMACHEN